MWGPPKYPFIEPLRPLIMRISGTEEGSWGAYNPTTSFVHQPFMFWRFEDLTYSLPVLNRGSCSAILMTYHFSVINDKKSSTDGKKIVTITTLQVIQVFILKRITVRLIIVIIVPNCVGFQVLFSGLRRCINLNL